MRGYLIEEYTHGNYQNQYEKLLSKLEEAALELCGNAVMEFSYQETNQGYARGRGVAVCDPRLSTPCC